MYTSRLGLRFLEYKTIFNSTSAPLSRAFLPLSPISPASPKPMLNAETGK